MTWTTAVVRCVRCAAVALTLPCVAAAQTSAPAASLYVPRAMKQAYAKGTRSPDGRPGPRYWQNHGRYTISITTASLSSNAFGRVASLPFTNARVSFPSFSNL